MHSIQYLYLCNFFYNFFNLISIFISYFLNPFNLIFLYLFNLIGLYPFNLIPKNLFNSIRQNIHLISGTGQAMGVER